MRKINVMFQLANTCKSMLNKHNMQKYKYTCIYDVLCTQSPQNFILASKNKAISFPAKMGNCYKQF